MQKALLTFLLFLFSSFALQAKTLVFVSIAPQKFLVERIGGETVEVEVIVPNGSSPHSYEPTLRQIISAKNGKAWFRIGESFELRLANALKNRLIIVDQREGVDLIPLCCSCHGDKDAHDPHIWLSPSLLKIQATQIAKTLTQINPDSASLYERNLELLFTDLDAVSQEIALKLSNKNNDNILVSHPAFGYFCRDYGLNQLSIEMEGKEPTPKYLTDLLVKARALKIRYVFLQKQYSTKGGERLAKNLKAKIIYLDPYAENVIETLKTLAEAFALE